jgi:hypothetical protein
MNVDWTVQSLRAFVNRKLNIRHGCRIESADKGDRRLAWRSRRSSRHSEVRFFGIFFSQLEKARFGELFVRHNRVLSRHALA